MEDRHSLQFDRRVDKFFKILRFFGPWCSRLKTRTQPIVGALESSFRVACIEHIPFSVRFSIFSQGEERHTVIFAKIFQKIVSFSLKSSLQVNLPQPKVLFWCHSVPYNTVNIFPTSGNPFCEISTFKGRKNLAKILKF